VGKMRTGRYISDDLSNGVEDWGEKPVCECYFFLEILEVID